MHDYLVPFIRQQRSAELLAKIKEAEEEKQRMQAELNRVLQKQLKDARRTGIGLAGISSFWLVWVCDCVPSWHLLVVIILS